MTLAEWVVQVDKAMKRDWCIDTADAGLSRDELEQWWRGGETPADFVAWFAEKHDLIRFEKGLFPCSRPAQA